MPGQTGYFDTPVVPVSAFAEGYNHPDCNYADGTPAILSVTSTDIAGPWVAPGTGHTLTINALGDQLVDSYGYSGPQWRSPIQSAEGQAPLWLRNAAPQGTACSVALVGSDGISRPLTGVTWADMTDQRPRPE